MFKEMNISKGSHRLPLEAKEQEALIRYFKYAYPGEHLIAIPNGGSRHPLEAANLKRQGVVAGVPDLFYPRPCGKYAGLWIELKRQKGAPSSISKSQQEMINYLNLKGYLAKVCYGWEHAKDLIGEYVMLDEESESNVVNVDFKKDDLEVMGCACGNLESFFLYVGGEVECLECNEMLPLEIKANVDLVEVTDD